MQTICHYKYALLDAMLLAMMASLYITDLNIETLIWVTDTPPFISN